MKKIVIIATSVLLLSCTGERSHSTYKYLHFDKNDVAHADQRCGKLIYEGDAVRKPLNDFSIRKLKELHYCPLCVTDSIYEDLTH